MSSSSPLSNFDKNIHSFHFFHNLERVWPLTRNFCFLSALNSKNHFPPIITKGQDTWTIGNEFEGRFFGTIFKGKVLKVINLPHIKQIKWELLISHHFVAKINLKLFKVSRDDTTIIIWKNKYNYPIKDKNSKDGLIEKEDWDNLVNKIDKVLKETPLDLYQYEATIISAKMEEIWTYVLNCAKMKEIAPKSLCEELDLNDKKTGDKCRCYYKEHTCYFDIKIINLDCRKGWNKWILVYEVMNGEPKLPRQKVIIHLTQINNNDCHFSMLHSFLDFVSNEMLKCLSIEKKYIFSCLKNKLEKKENKNE